MVDPRKVVALLEKFETLRRQSKARLRVELVSKEYLSPQERLDLETLLPFILSEYRLNLTP